MVWSVLILYNMIIRRRKQSEENDDETEDIDDNGNNVLHVDDDYERGHVLCEQLVQQVWLEFGPNCW